MRDPFGGLISSVESRYNFLNNSEGGSAASQSPKTRMYANMFVEDLSLRAFPYSLDGKNEFTAEIKTGDQETRALVANAVPSIYISHTDIKEAIRFFAQNSIRFLARSRLVLEIEYFYPPKADTDTPAAFRINLLSPEQVARAWWGYVYRIRSVGARAPYKEKLDQRSLVVVSLPRTVQRSLRSALRIIGTLDDNHIAISDFTSGRHDPNDGWNLRAYRRKIDSLALQALRTTGWTARGLLSDHLLGPAAAWRAIQFSRLAVVLRDLALKGLQEAIEKAGQKMGFSATIEIAGELTEHHLDQMEIDLQHGVRPIEDFFIPRPPVETAPY